VFGPVGGYEDFVKGWKKVRDTFKNGDDAEEGG
jgi:hypothetical protein